MDFGFEELLNASKDKSKGVSAGSIFARALNMAMPYSDYDEILQGEAHADTAKYRHLSYEAAWVEETEKMWADYEGHRKGYVYVCPELRILWPLIKKETDTERASDSVRKHFRENVEVAVQGRKPDMNKVIAIDTNIVFENEKYRNYWFSSTIKGINIRPGIMGLADGDGHDVDKTEPLHMDDMNPHGLMAGRTGSGKSVALNTIIASLLQEFPPWELDVNLADFKIVEMSRYGQTGYEAPHISKIAATEAMEYVVSVMYDMYESMSVRQAFFGAVGVQNIEDFRKKFGVVLPHVIFIVDEFQQMFELANNKQAAIIDQLIKMVTKLGRAAGYHLLFASQSMSGTLSSDVQTNFKMRICLPAAADVSNVVLGNSASAELRGKGYCYTNCEGGASEANIKYRVPLLRAKLDNPGELTDLQKILKWNKELSELVGYSRPMNFFRDSAIRPMHPPDGMQEKSNCRIRTFEDDIKLFRRGIQNAVDGDKELEDIFLLGDSYVYKEPGGKNFDVTLEYFNLKIGDRKNILCLGDSAFQRAYMTELLAMQYTERRDRNENIVVNADSVMSDIYDIDKTLKAADTSDFSDILPEDFISTFVRKYSTRDIINEYVQYCDAQDRMDEEVRAGQAERDRKFLDLVIASKFQDEKYVPYDPDDFVEDRPMSAGQFYEKYAAYIIGERELKEYIRLNEREARYVELHHQEEGQSVEEMTRECLEQKNNKLYDGVMMMRSVYESIRDIYTSGIRDGKFSFKNVKTLTFWVLGFSNSNSIIDERKQHMIEPMLRNCTNYGIRVIFVGSQAGDISAIARTFGYIFIQSANEANYTRYGMDMAKEIKDNVVRFKAVNDVVTDVKPYLYPLPGDEKMFKIYEREYEKPSDKDFFRYF